MAKLKIEDIRVEADISRPAILWRIGTDRFHCWLDPSTNEWEEVVYKNSIAKHDEPGYYHTRQLYRVGSKATADMFAEVLAVVERDGLVAKAQEAHAANVARAVRKGELQASLYKLETTALNCWMNGAFDRLPALHKSWQSLKDDLLLLELAP